MNTAKWPFSIDDDGTDVILDVALPKFLDSAQAPRCGRDVAETWPKCGRDTAEMWPRGGRDVAELWPRCARNVA